MKKIINGTGSGEWVVVSCKKELHLYGAVLRKPSSKDHYSDTGMYETAR